MAKKQKIKNFEIQTIANMYVMLKITEDYISENIGVIEFSNQQTKLMAEIDESLNIMNSSIDSLKDRVYILGVDNKINIDFSKDIQKEIDKLLMKIR